MLPRFVHDVGLSSDTDGTNSTPSSSRSSSSSSAAADDDAALLLLGSAEKKSHRTEVSTTAHLEASRGVGADRSRTPPWVKRGTSDYAAYRRDGAVGIPAAETAAVVESRLAAALNKATVYAAFLMGRVRGSSSEDDQVEAITPASSASVVNPASTLLPHQRAGVQWLLALFENGLSGLLADEMGLGKTIQALVFLGRLIDLGVLGPHVIVCPLSTLPNWQRELAIWLPGVPTVTLHGDAKARQRARKTARGFGRKLSDDAMATLPPSELIRHAGGIILTTFEVATQEAAFLRTTSPSNPRGLGAQIGALVVDEAQRLKNFDCQLMRSLQTVPCDGRYILTGTPVQNTLAELWSVLHFIAPDVFESLADFEAWFESASGTTSDILAAKDPRKSIQSFFAARSDVNRVAAATNIRADVGGGGGGDDTGLSDVAALHARAVVRMHRALRPFMLRRTKQDVDLKLPPLVEVVLHCPLSARQRDLYLKATRPQQHRHTAGRPKYDNHRLHITQLRLLCGHPYLIKGGDPYRDEIVANDLKTRWPRNKALEQRYHADLVRDGGKLALLMRMLPLLVERGHRVLVFSQFSLVLDIIEEALNYFPVKLGAHGGGGGGEGADDEEDGGGMMQWVRLDGSQSADERRDSIATFSRPRSPARTFLLTTRAGGVGLNLMAADTVILFDGDYNPHNDTQAIARAHRIGQTKPVAVYRLVARQTVEETVLRFGLGKTRMERVLIRCGGFDGSGLARDAAPEPPIEAVDTEAGKAAVVEAEVQQAEESAMQLRAAEVAAAAAVARALAEQLSLGNETHDTDAAVISEEALGRIVDRDGLIQRWAAIADGASAGAVEFVA